MAYRKNNDFNVPFIAIIAVPFQANELFDLIVCTVRSRCRKKRNHLSAD
jgi:hypothetical protein